MTYYFWLGADAENRASGGLIEAGRSYLVGEKGPEEFRMRPLDNAAR